MQGRVGDGDAADPDRLQPRDRGELAGAADLDVDRLEDRLGLLGREFVRQRPARRARDLAEPALPVEPVDLVDHAVDVEGQVGPLRFDHPVMGDEAGEIAHAGDVVRDGHAPGLDRAHHPELGVRGQRRDLAPAMGVEAQRAGGGDRGVLLAERAGGGVARIGELARLVRILGLGAHAGVERGEIGLRHIDLAANLEDRGRAGRQVLRDVGDGAGIGGDVLAGGAVAAGGGEDERALLVAQRAGEAVDLGLGGQRQLVLLAQAEEPAHPGEEIGHLLLGEGIVEAEHRQSMADLGEEGGGRGAHLLRRAVLADQMRKLRLQRRVAPHQRIIVGVRNLGRILGMIEAIVMRDLAREPFQLGGGSASSSISLLTTPG